jgi:hypothetical protein
LGDSRSALAHEHLSQCSRMSRRVKIWSPYRTPVDVDDHRLAGSPGRNSAQSRSDPRSSQSGCARCLREGHPVGNVLVLSTVI